MATQTNSVKGYKVFNPDFTCKGMTFEVGKEFTVPLPIKICNHGLHFCLKAQDCFSYYPFNPTSIVCEVEATGEVQYQNDDSKACTNILKIIRQLTWAEVLVAANSGADNTGHSNSGYRNSGNSNSGNWNSGDGNSGNSNSGNWNSGNRNSGDNNSGNSNSGNWNSGNRNSGDSNSGYRNSGAFSTNPNPKLILFDKQTDINIVDWEKSEVVQTMNELLETTIWIYASDMTPEEKEKHPKYDTTDGYLKTKTMHEAWADMWGNLSGYKKKLFLNLPHFDKDKFKEITGIEV